MQKTEQCNPKSWSRNQEESSRKFLGSPVKIQNYFFPIKFISTVLRGFFFFQSRHKSPIRKESKKQQKKNTLIFLLLQLIWIYPNSICNSCLPFFSLTLSNSYQNAFSTEATAEFWTLFTCSVEAVATKDIGHCIYCLSSHNWKYWKVRIWSILK